MTAHIIDGKATAATMLASIAAAVSALKQTHGFTPGLAAVLVGEDPASQVYVRSKGRQTTAAGMASFEHKMPAATPEADLIALVERLNRDPDVDGILVQLPLPRHIDAAKVIGAVDPAKDVDGFHPLNAGRLANGKPALVPCTPAGCLILARQAAVALSLPDLAGMNAVVVGRSNTVGKPMAQLLLAQGCTVTVAHSQTRDLPAVIGGADLLFVAVGKAQMIKGEWIKPGAIVIDVGINRVDLGNGQSRLVGDVDFVSAVDRAGAITPVPGGVGPMTIACLLRNTLEAACARRNIDMPVL